MTEANFSESSSKVGLPDVIFDRLDPAPVSGRGQRPPGVRRWINIADPGDIVAIPCGLAGAFTGIDADLTTPAGGVQRPQGHRLPVMHDHRSRPGHVAGELNHRNPG